MELHEPLNRYTSFRIGGPADYYFEPADRKDLTRLVRYLNKRKVPFIVIGGGSNLLVSDDGVRSAVINVEKGLNRIQDEGATITVEAGVRIARFVDFCIQKGLQGVEMLPGIPGTIGGAVVMNAGAYGGEISDYLVEVEILRDGEIVRVQKKNAGFAYRRSGFQNDVVLGAMFTLPEGDRAALIRARRAVLVKRNQTQPLNMPNSGSVFKNPQGKFAAKLVEDAGLKGTTIGNAKISERHGNFIVNMGNATAMDIIELIKLARKTVVERFGIKLELELKLIGFSESLYQEVHA